MVLALAALGMLVTRIGGEHERDADSILLWQSVAADDLRGVQSDGGFGGGALYIAPPGPGIEPPAPVVGEPELSTTDEPTPSPEPSPAPPPPAVQPQTPLEQLVCSYGWSCATALRVLYCESGGRPTAIGGGANYGLFQINRIHAGRFEGFWERWMIPEYNVEYAWAIYSGRGWSAWSCY